MSARRSSEHSGGRGKGLQLTFTELLGAHPYLTWVLRRRVLGWPSALCNTWRTHSSCEPQSMVSAQCQVTRAQILCPVRTIGLGVRPARKPLTTWARTLLCLSCLRAPENSLGEWGGVRDEGLFFLPFLFVTKVFLLGGNIPLAPVARVHFSPVMYVPLYHNFCVYFCPLRVTVTSFCPSALFVALKLNKYLREGREKGRW